MYSRNRGIETVFVNLNAGAVLTKARGLQTGETMANSAKMVRVGHIYLEVSELETAKRFYAVLFEKLGFEVILEDKESVGWSNGSFVIFLSKPAKQRVSKKKPGKDDFVIADHFALPPESRADVDSLVAFMKGRGIDVSFPAEGHPEFGPNYYSVSYCEPDNNVVELYSA